MRPGGKEREKEGAEEKEEVDGLIVFERREEVSLKLQQCSRQTAMQVRNKFSMLRRIAEMCKLGNYKTRKGRDDTFVLIN